MLLAAVAVACGSLLTFVVLLWRVGVDDKSYIAVFRPVIQKVMEMYRPSAVVLQCGADSLTGAYTPRCGVARR